MKSKLKPPGIKRLELLCDLLLSISAFKINLRRYSQGADDAQTQDDNCKALAKLSKYLVGCGGNPLPEVSSSFS